jgi:type IV secretory pathway TrbD component
MTRVYKGVNRALTIFGVERRLFFMAAVVGVSTFNYFGSLLGGLVMFLLLYALARWASAYDPEIVRIALRSTTLKRAYDPLKRADTEAGW